uniref:Uncharacterized protein n=2 Tax=Corethron hystrix TaxID=216773 RepID=A0A6U5KUU7_9STRA
MGVRSALFLIAGAAFPPNANAFSLNFFSPGSKRDAAYSPRRAAMPLRSSTDVSFDAAVSVTGEELELALHDWDLPLVIDAYATWSVVACDPARGPPEAAKKRPRFYKSR